MTLIHPDFHSDFGHVSAWVFDLDNTLYPSECDLFSQVDQRMSAYVAEKFDVDLVEARRLQKQYYADYGTTLNGLMRKHDVDPHDFLDYVHDIDHSPLSLCARLNEGLNRIKGKKYVFTNGSVKHAENVLKARGVDHQFDGLFDIALADFEPKPAQGAFDRFLGHFGVDPTKSAMFEDMHRNLETAHAMGFTTVLVRTGKDWSHEPAHLRPAGLDETHAHVHHATDDLADFLLRLTDPAAPVNK